MIDVVELRGIMAKREVSQAKMAKILGMTPKTFYLKMKKGIFDSDEIGVMIRELDIKNPLDVFFLQ